MIALIKGKILEKKPTEVIIDCNGIGYQVFISVLTSSKIPNIGNEIQLRTILIPREDQLQLFGFYDETEKNLFRELISISGIGPKTAIGILSAVDATELLHYIETENTKALQKLPGIGKKSAERLLVELKDKVGKFALEQPLVLDTDSSIKYEAIAALCALGFTRAVAEKAIKKAYSEASDKIDNIETLIKLSLQFAMESK